MSHGHRYLLGLDPALGMNVVRVPSIGAHPRVLIIPTTNLAYYDEDGAALPEYWGRVRAINGYPGYDDGVATYIHPKTEAPIA